MLPHLMFTVVLISRARSSDIPQALSASPIPKVITIGAGASPSEQHGASTLLQTLNAIAGSKLFHLRINGTSLSSTAGAEPQIAVGYGAATSLGLSPATIGAAALGLEGYMVVLHGGSCGSQQAGGKVARCQIPPGSVVLTGAENAPRGALYAVVHFLEGLGVQYLATDAVHLPDRLSATLPPSIGAQFVPEIEYRELFEWQSQLSPEYDVQHHLNHRLLTPPISGINALVAANDAAHGGTIDYATPPGMVHTSYALLSCTPGGSPTDPSCGGMAPPASLWKTHRGFFWPQDKPTYGQLCWSNASLVDFLKNRVKAFLRATPAATIISVRYPVLTVGFCVLTGTDIRRLCSCYE